MKAPSRQTIEISSNTIFRGLAVIALLFFAYLIEDVLAMLFFALIIASAVSVPVGWLKKLRVPRTLGVIIVYILTILFN